MAQKSAREVLWTPPDLRSTQMWRFIQRVNERRGLAIANFEELYRWSIEDVAAFWEEVWHFFEIKASRSYDEVSPSRTLLRPRVFPSSESPCEEPKLMPAGPPDRRHVPSP